MAKYWVNGGVDNLWSTAGNWSTTSGGAGGAGQPVTTDDVYFDANSAGYACTINVNETCRDIRFAGYTGTFTINSGVYLQTYGQCYYDTAVTYAGAGIWWFYESTGGGNIGWTGAGSVTLPWSFYFGGTAGGTWTVEKDITWTGGTSMLAYFRATNDPSTDTINNLGSGEKFILSGDGWTIRTANSTSSGESRGTLILDCIGDTTLFFNHGNDNYGFGNTVQMTVAKTLTLKGYNLSRVCRVANSFSLIMGDLATLAYDVASIPDEIPYFYGCDSAMSVHYDSGNQQTKYRVYFRSIVSSTAYWYDDTDSAENTIVYFNHAYSSITSNQWRLYNYGSKLFVDSFAYNSSISSGYISGDADIEFRLFNIEQFTASSYIWYFEDGPTYTFTEQFRIYNNDQGITTVRSTDGVVRANLHVFHNCQMELHNVAMTRIDGRSDGQGIGLEGDDATITDCLGVYNGHHAFAYNYIQNNVAGNHPLYTNDNLGKTPITISGTVKIGATPQQNAVVLVIVKRTEAPDASQLDGNYWGQARDYYKLQHVLVTDVNGEWTCQVPSGVEVITEAHYDSGAQKYNSLSKPYIDAT